MEQETKLVYGRTVRFTAACSTVAPPLSAALLVSQSEKVSSAPSPSTPSDTAAINVLYDQTLRTVTVARKAVIGRLYNQTLLRTSHAAIRGTSNTTLLARCQRF